MFQSQKVEVVEDLRKRGVGVSGVTGFESAPQRLRGGCFLGAGSPAILSDVDGVQVWSQALPVDRIWNVLKSLVTLAR